LIVMLALVAGMWLDARLDSRPLFTIGLILGSVPVTLVIIFRTVLSAAQRLLPPAGVAATSGSETDGSQEDRRVAMGD
jgi:F0F1-type ATP synthase assembly protein I